MLKKFRNPANPSFILWTLSLWTLLGLSPLQETKADSIGFSISQNSSEEMTVLVVDDSNLQPIHDALVTVSETSTQEQNLPDQEGPSSHAFTSAQKSKILTVAKPGYATTTLIGLQNSKVTIFLKPLTVTTEKVIASGKTSGWPNAENLLGKPVYLGFVLRSLRVSELLRFNPDLFISPLRDTIDIWGKRKIPSNLVMPEQSVPILFGSIKLNKPDYRLPLPVGHETRIAVSQGQINSDDLVAIAKEGSKAGVDVLNQFHFNHLGMTDSFVPASDLKIDLHAQHVMSDAFTVKVAQPPFPADVISASVMDIQGDWQHLIPTDIKAPLTLKNPNSSRTSILKGPAGVAAQRYGILTLAIAEDKKRYSGIVTETHASRVEPGDFLNAQSIADSPTLPAQIKLQAPEKGLAQIIFETPAQSQGQNRPNKSSPIWYVFALPSAGAVSFSTEAAPIGQKISKYSALQLEFDNTFDEHQIQGETLITRLKRFSASVGTISNP